MMQISKSLLLAAAICVSTICCRSQCNCGTGGKKSNLTLVPIDRSTSLAELDDYEVKEFVDLRTNTDRSGLFGSDKKGRHDHPAYFAGQVPYGRYRIRLQSKSGHDSFGRLIDVCQPDESVEVPREFARVHIIPLVVDGKSVNIDSSSSIKVKKFQNRLDDTDISELFKQGVADQIPYGYYDLELILPLGSVKREVDVFQPYVSVYSDSPGYMGDAFTSGPGGVVSGELKNIPAGEKTVFMIMSGVYFPFTINSVVSDTGLGSGSFSFVGNNPSGEFMIYTVGKSGILDAREINIPRDLGSKITIDLAHPSPPNINHAP